MEHIPLSPRRRGQLWLRLGLRLLFALCAAALLAFAGSFLFSLLLPFGGALFLAWLLNPAIHFLQNRIGGSRRLWSTSLLLALFALAGGLALLLGYHLFQELRSLADNWQTLWGSVPDTLTFLGDRLERLSSLLPSEIPDWLHGLSLRLLDQMQASASSFLSSAASAVGSAAMKLPSFAAAVLVFLLACCFIAADYPRLRQLVIRRMSPDTLGLLRFLRYTTSSAFGGYLKAQVLLSSGVFLLLLGGFALMGQTYVFLPALLLAVLDFIPIIGAGIVLLPWAGLSLFSGNPALALRLLVLWGVITLFRRVAEPKVVGKHTGLPPILSLLSIYTGMKLAGVWGMILAPVVFLVALHVCRSGVFDGLVSDIRLAFRDIRSVFKGSI